MYSLPAGIHATTNGITKEAFVIFFLRFQNLFHIALELSIIPT